MAEVPNRKDLRFLVVDDVATGRVVLETILSRYGQVDTASGGESALDSYRDAAASGEMYDLLLVDFMMPGMDGITMLKELRALERERGLPETTVVMTTAVDEREYVQAALRAGAGGYFIKPLNVAKIVELLKTLELVKA